MTFEEIKQRWPDWHKFGLEPDNYQLVDVSAEGVSFAIPEDKRYVVLVNLDVLNEMEFGVRNEENGQFYPMWLLTLGNQFYAKLSKSLEPNDKACVPFVRAIDVPRHSCCKMLMMFRSYS